MDSPETPSRGSHHDEEKLREGGPAGQGGPQGVAGWGQPRTPSPAGQRLCAGGRSAGSDHRRYRARGDRGVAGDQRCRGGRAEAAGQEAQRRRCGVPRAAGGSGVPGGPGRPGREATAAQLGSEVEIPVYEARGRRGWGSGCSSSCWLALAPGPTGRLSARWPRRRGSASRR